MWQFDPGSAAIGMLASLIGWLIFIFVIFYPQMRKLKALIHTEIETEAPDLIKSAFRTLKADLESEEDNEAKQLLAEASIFLTGIATHLVMESWDQKDNKIKAFLRGEINSMAETFKKSFMTRMQTEAAKYGIEFDEGSDGIGEQEPTEEMAKFMRIAKAGMMLKKELEGGM